MGEKEDTGKFFALGTELDIDTLLYRGSDFAVEPLRWKICKRGVLRLLLSCAVVLGVQVFFLLSVFLDARPWGVLSTLAVLLTSGVLLSPTLQLPFSETTRWIRMLVFREKTDFCVYHYNNSREDRRLSVGREGMVWKVVGKGRSASNRVVRNRLLLLVAFSYLLYTSFVVQKLGFKHRYEYRQLDIAFPFSNASASLHFKAGNRLYQYLSPEIDFGHGLQRNASLECQDKHTCPGYALSYVKVCSACTDVTASLERNCAFVPGIDEEICSWSSPYSKAELDELPTHLLSSKVTERPFINSTSNPGEVLSVTSIQWADRTAPKLEPVATECTLDLCGVLLDISEHISPERKNTAAREILLDLYAPLIPFDNVVGGFPLELERADVSSLRELVAGSLTGEVVSDYLTNEDAASEQLSYLAKNVKNDDIKADLANLASSLARLLSQSIRSDVYQHLKDGDEPWKFSKRVDLLRFSLARYLPVIAALFAMQLFYNGLILAKGLGLPVLSRSPWSLAVMLAVVDVTKSSDVKVYLKNVELMQTDEVHFEVGEASEAGDESREASLDVGEKFVGQA